MNKFFFPSHTASGIITILAFRESDNDDDNSVVI